MLARWREIDALEPARQGRILSVVDSLVRDARPAALSPQRDRRNGDATTGTTYAGKTGTPLAGTSGG